MWNFVASQMLQLDVIYIPCFVSGQLPWEVKYSFIELTELSHESSKLRSLKYGTKRSFRKNLYTHFILLEFSNQGSTRFNRGNNAVYKILLRKLRKWHYKIRHEGENNNSFGWILTIGIPWMSGVFTLYILLSQSTGYMWTHSEQNFHTTKTILGFWYNIMHHTIHFSTSSWCTLP